MNSSCIYITGISSYFLLKYSVISKTSGIIDLKDMYEINDVNDD